MPGQTPAQAEDLALELKCRTSLRFTRWAEPTDSAYWHGRDRRKGTFLRWRINVESAVTFRVLAKHPTISPSPSSR
jgi:hypothetical protein